ncbi:MAG: pyridoxine 5'-phosphate synthase [Spirochaetia bacterium]|nr:pyridoxine 5'-phosphate synthase [Spirochaetia bacterium]
MIKKNKNHILSVNLDHVATLRQQRHTLYPDIVTAAGICEQAGADGITLHLRQDRRHIQNRDVELIREISILPLTVEMSCSKEITDLMCRIRPEKVTLVPEKPEELTTEGGLNLKEMKDTVKRLMEEMQSEGIHVCLFLEPEITDIELAAELKCDAVEIHTGTYAHNFDARNTSRTFEELERIQKSVETGTSAGLMMNVGHGLHYQNVIPVAGIPSVTEFSIGHGIISRAVFTGLKAAVSDMAEIIKQ